VITNHGNIFLTVKQTNEPTTSTNLVCKCYSILKMTFNQLIPKCMYEL